MSNHTLQADISLSILAMSSLAYRGGWITLFIGRYFGHELPRCYQDSDHDRCGYNQYSLTLLIDRHTLYDTRRQ